MPFDRAEGDVHALGNPHIQTDARNFLPIADALAQKSMREGDPTTRSDFNRKRGIVARMTGDPRAAAESMNVALEIKPTSAAALNK